MFEINTEIICNIIKKAREVDVTDDVFPTDTPDNLSEVEWKQNLAEYQEDLSYIELKNLINDLEPDQQNNVIALMYIGRGDFEPIEWKEAIHAAESIPRRQCADYLITKKMLPDYLSEGLAKFDDFCEE